MRGEATLTKVARAFGTLARGGRLTVRVMLRYALVIAGLTLFTVAGWVVIPALGMAVAGLSCLIFEWIIKDGAE